MELAIAPEGTRKPVTEWKKGFYFIALKAGVPIMLIGLDYSNKEARFLGLFQATGDYERTSQNQVLLPQPPGKPENFLL